MIPLKLKRLIRIKLTCPGWLLKNFVDRGLELCIEALEKVFEEKREKLASTVSMRD
jgi:hypothetical protein